MGMNEIVETVTDVETMLATNELFVNQYATTKLSAWTPVYVYELAGHDSMWSVGEPAMLRTLREWWTLEV